ncbi:hypothetical protein D9619_003297 [Psilocybe cf. subviscida]|uniref:HCP-like protein n=1 Tax=Psilocybe cf. subviscida TaxID=2480587 RepID=A0A8H5AWR2_9AGAR|nr:hypothetical protein D9619_003297 [Psilocybe cf. subviscida]
MAATYLPPGTGAYPTHVNSNTNLASNSAAPSSYSHPHASSSSSYTPHFDDNDAAYESTALSSYTPSMASTSTTQGATFPVSRASPLDQLVRRTSSRRLRTVAAARDREAHSQMHMSQRRIQEEQRTANPTDHGNASRNDQHQSASSSSPAAQQLSSSSILLPSNPAAPEQVPRISIDNPSSFNTHSVAYTEYTQDEEYEYNYEDYYGTSDADGDEHHYNAILDGYSPQHTYSDDTGIINGVNEQDTHAFSPTPLPEHRPMSTSGPQLAQYAYSHRGRASHSYIEDTNDPYPAVSTNPTITISSTPSQTMLPHPGPSSEAGAKGASSTPFPSTTPQPTRTPRLGIPPPINTSDLSSNNPNNSPLPSPLLHSSFAFRRERVDSIISSSEHDTDADYSRDYSRQQPRGSLATINSSSDGGRTTYALGAIGLSLGLGVGQDVSKGAGERQGGVTNAPTDRPNVHSNQIRSMATPALRESWASGTDIRSADGSRAHASFNDRDLVNDERVGAVSSVRSPEEARVEREAGGLVVKAAQGGVARPVEEAAFVHGEHMGERVTVQLPEDMREGKMKVLERLAQQQQQVGRLTPQVPSPGAGLRPEHAIVNRSQAGSELYSQYSYYSYQSPVPSPRSEYFGNVKPGGSPSPKSVTFAPSPTPTPAIGPTAPEEYLQQGIQHHEANRLQESARCFERSAIEGGGCGVGMLMYGLTLRHGWGCRKNESMGFKWLMKAAEHAIGDLERVRASGGEAEIVGGVQTELVLAIYEVGQCFFHGWGVPKDMKMGVSYYRVAARLGDGDAQNDLAFCLANGKGCKKDKKSAAKWYRAAVAQGQSDVGLAWIYKEKYQ